MCTRTSRISKNPQYEAFVRFLLRAGILTYGPQSNDREATFPYFLAVLATASLVAWGGRFRRFFVGEGRRVGRDEKCQARFLSEIGAGVVSGEYDSDQ